MDEQEFTQVMEDSPQGEPASVPEAKEEDFTSDIISDPARESTIDAFGQPDATGFDQPDAGFDQIPDSGFDSIPEPEPEVAAPFDTTDTSQFLPPAAPVTQQAPGFDPAKDLAGSHMSPSALDLWQAAWEDELRQRDAQEAQKRKEMKESAERWLDDYHDKQTDSRLAKMEFNRKTEADAREHREALIQEATNQNPFRRVFELIGEQQHDADTSRMYSLLVSLKAKGKGGDFA